MLCRLLLMRHAKASNDSASLTDHERPLDAQGRSGTPKVATEMMKLGLWPQFALCSDSQRTQETWELVAHHLDTKIPSRKSPRLYNSDVNAYLDEIAQQNFEGHTFLLIGHNPVIEDCIRLLASETIVMKPASLAILEIHANSWKEALTRFGLWKLVNVLQC